LIFTAQAFKWRTLSINMFANSVFSSKRNISSRFWNSVSS
jgi:hypothetical protein